MDLIKKKNPMWDLVFADDRMKESDKFLSKHLKLAILHEQKCVKMRLKQIEHYLDRIALMEQGMEYTETFKKVPCTYGISFPKDEYEKLLIEETKKQKVKK